MINAERNYKDTLFRMVFQDKRELLNLYNALNGTSYDNPEDLEINTLENAVYMNLKNDISFILAFHINLYEHQATFNPNMPLRNLFYISRLYEKFITTKSLYSSTLVKIPTPKFVIFYNGLKDQPEKTVLKLSNAFINSVDNPELELTVTMININFLHNQELMEHCKTLKEYAIYIDRVRHYTKEMELRQAVEQAVNECISEGILQDFLTRCKAEVIQMSIFEYDEEFELEKLRKAEREAGYNDGLHEGIDKGYLDGVLQGKVKIICLIRNMMNRGLDYSAIAEILELDELYVKNVIDFIGNNPKCTEEEVAALT